MVTNESASTLITQLVGFMGDTFEVDIISPWQSLTVLARNTFPPLKKSMARLWLIGLGS
jgi:hypothetical protein